MCWSSSPAPWAEVPKDFCFNPLDYVPRAVPSLRGIPWVLFSRCPSQHTRIISRSWPRCSHFSVVGQLRVFHSSTGVLDPIWVVVSLPPALSVGHSFPTVLYLCRDLFLLMCSILHLSLLNHLQVFQATSPVYQGHFKFQPCLPGHLQPSRLSQCLSSSRNADQIPCRPRSCVCNTRHIPLCWQLWVQLFSWVLPAFTHFILVFCLTCRSECQSGQ